MFYASTSCKVRHEKLLTQHFTTLFHKMFRFQEFPKEILFYVRLPPLQACRFILFVPEGHPEKDSQ
jgi:hypothetical protein